MLRKRKTQTQKAPHLIQGQRAERQASHYLRKQGLRLRARNYHSPFGEIDLIMETGDTVVFVEVRYRNSLRFGGPLESITRHKQAKLRRSAECYLQQHHTLTARPCRFDVVAITPDRHGGQRVQWIRDAF